ncbi:hypothetical protein CW304_13595 [Bacillus sp. UFRGS-B20]|nr:hypothetical protein CW304_13595 [Bacillus sp. UFRGS-B20]
MCLKIETCRPYSEFEKSAQRSPSISEFINHKRFLYLHKGEAKPAASERIRLCRAKKEVANVMRPSP